MIAHLFSAEFVQLATVTLPESCPPLLVAIPHTSEPGSSFFRHVGGEQYVEVRPPDLCVITLPEWPLQSGDTFEVIQPVRR